MGSGTPPLTQAGLVEAALAQGDLDAALRGVMDEVRASPAAVGPRLALFQLAAITGDWARAKRQLETLAEVDPEAVLMARTYGAAIEAEALRRAVFAGEERPVCLGEPPVWLAMLSEALALDARGSGAAAGELRQRALAAAEPVGGSLDGVEFAWIMDADVRLGPVLELVTEGRYRWLPLASVREVRAEPPRDHTDLVWRAVHLTLAGGGELPAFIPVRYPGSETAADPRLRLARLTTWADQPGGQFGLGQRLFATDTADHAFLDVRCLRLGPGAHG